MPFVSQAQRKWMFSQKPAMAKRWAKETPKRARLPEHVKKSKKAKIVINNRLKGDFGAMNPKTNKVEINIRAHKGDKAELASTIKHELLHVKHPKMTEKQIYKKSRKTKIAPEEQHKLIAKLRHKKINYAMGALKRKYKLGRGDTKPGEFINRIKHKQMPSTESSDELPRRLSVAMRGMV